MPLNRFYHALFSRSRGHVPVIFWFRLFKRQQTNGAASLWRIREAVASDGTKAWMWEQLQSGKVLRRSDGDFLSLGSAVRDAEANGFHQITDTLDLGRPEQEETRNT
jgi:hypothetical protein